jgi:hypothetical protein
VDTDKFDHRGDRDHKERRMTDPLITNQFPALWPLSMLTHNPYEFEENAKVV